jgi:hypothetical protein
LHPPWQCRSSSVRFDPHAVVHGKPKLLLASEIALGRLDGDVTEQELNLVQFATGKVTETSTGAAEIMRCQSQRQQLGSTKSATNQHRDHRVIT